MRMYRADDGDGRRCCDRLHRTAEGAARCRAATHRSGPVVPIIAVEVAAGCETPAELSDEDRDALAELVCREAGCDNLTDDGDGRCGPCADLTERYGLDD